MTVLQRIVATLLGLLLVLAALVFASIALGVILAAGLATWAWLWWRARSQPRKDGRIIEGEYEQIEERERHGL